jgi:tetratricopeptide (TPR) repeat protein
LLNGKKRALIIGVSDYDKLQPLTFCRNDASSMFRLLLSLGYEIEDNTNLSGYVRWQDMRDIIIEYFNNSKVRRDDTVIFYFSGHGVPDANGGVYLGTSEIDPDLPSKRGLSFDELTKIMQGSNSSQIVAILDCCYSGSAKISKGNEDDRAKLGLSAISKVSRSINQGEGICLLASSQSFQEAYNLEERDHSLFTYFLLEGLSGNYDSINSNGFVTVDTLSNYIYDKFMELPENKRPKQKPLRKVEASGDIILAYYPQLGHPNTPISNSSDLNSLIAEGKELIDSKDYHKAFEFWDNVTHNYVSPEAWYYKGVAVSHLGEQEEALRCFEVCIQSDPTHAGAWENKGVCLLNKNNIDEALQCFEKSLAFTKTNETDLVKCNRWFVKGYCLEKQKNYTEALECYDKSIALFPKAEQAISQKGHVLFAQNKINEADTCFNEALDIDPNLSTALYGKGQVKSNQKKYKDAVPYFAKAIEIAKETKQIGNIEGLYLTMAFSQLNLKEYEEALKSINNGLETSAKNVDLLFAKAVTLEALERFEEAISYYEKVMKLNSNYSNVPSRIQNIKDFLASSGGRLYDTDGKSY